MKPSNSHTEGMALLLVLGILAALTVGTSAMFSLMHITMTQAHKSEQRLVCQNLAEAGLNKAIAELTASHRDYRGEQDVALGEGAYSVEVAPANGTDTFQIAASGFIKADDVVLAKSQIRAEVLFNGDKATIKRWEEVRSR